MVKIKGENDLKQRLIQDMYRENLGKKNESEVNEFKSILVFIGGFIVACSLLAIYETWIH